ncbi:hypothetical protein ABW19_dt0204856 [Dactylella cylindrospora]|nr:hypothetical protein ABW19_dt0204856 [Dactylella cylindrospora]
MPNPYAPIAPAASPPSMPPVKRAKLDPPSQANSPGPSTPGSQPFSQSAAAASMSMPPPSSTSPIQKPVDTKELSDVLFSTGVDLQAEEQYLYNDTPAASFNASMSMLNQPGISAEQTQINREEAEQSGKYRHYQDPFLSNQKLQATIHKKLIDQKLSSSGEAGAFSETISIAVQERVRELLTTAYTFARHRRQGNTLKGFGEWADIAIGESEGRNGKLREDKDPDSAISPSGANPRKRSFAMANAGTQTTRQPSLISETARSLRQIATDERLIEEARIAARQQRLNGGKPVAATATADGNPGESVNSPAGSVAPEPEKRMTAKEAKKAQNSRFDEIQSHKAANETASLMLGGGRKKKYSWMTAGSGGGGGMGSGASTPKAPGTPGPATPGATTAVAAPNGPIMYWSKRMGEWNEQGERGKGIQLRDWTLALEADGREKKTLIKSYLKMK